MYGIFNIYLLSLSVWLYCNKSIYIPGFDIIQSREYREWSNDILDPRPISNGNWIVDNKLKKR